MAGERAWAAEWSGQTRELLVVSSQKNYQVMRWMMFNRMSAAKVRAMTIAAASTLKASLRVVLGDSMGTPLAWLCEGEDWAQMRETHAA